MAANGSPRLGITPLVISEPCRIDRGLNHRTPTATLFGMSKFTASDALELSVPERLQLVEDIWNTIADAPEALELNDEEKRLIDERLEACHRNPGVGSPWADVIARIAARKK